MRFENFRNAQQFKFESMPKQLFTVDINPENLWQTYLNAFPPGTNPIYIECTEHDCSCCRHFIKTVGNLISIQNGNIDSIWNISNLETPYKEVAETMHKTLMMAPIKNVFLHYERNVGTIRNVQLLDSGETLTWHHFQLRLPKSVVSNDVNSELSKYKSSFDVLLRSLSEITLDAIQTVGELINDNNLIRCQEKLGLLNTFLEYKLTFDALPQEEQTIYVWETVIKQSEAFCHIGNTSIGTLLKNFSSDMDLETAVKNMNQ